MAGNVGIEHDYSRPLLSQKPLDFRDGDARLPSNGNGADFADLLTHRRTVNGCKPRRLATSPERSRRVFSVLITRIDYHKYVNPSTAVHPIVPDPEGIINQGQGNLTARAIQVRQDEPINKRALLNLFQAIIANNRAGGWRKLNKNLSQ